MQDSIEDYIRITRNTNEEATKTNKKANVTTEVIKQCNSRAVKIVEFAIEGKLRTEIFLKCLPYINQSHFQDIVEERAISKLCGYPICGKKIPDMPKKQYYISTKSNKVYDIIDRKNYCSNFCYKACLHIKKQVENSPLWLRTVDTVPKYQLMPNSESGLPGEEIDQGVVSPIVDKTFTSVSAFTAISLTNMTDNEKDTFKKNNKTEKVVKPASKYSKGALLTINEMEGNSDEEETKTHNTDNNNTSNETLQSSEKCVSTNLSSTSIEINDPQPSREESIKVSACTGIKKATKKKKTKSKLVDLETHLKKCFKEWLTLETYIYLFGDVKVKEKLSESTLEEFFEKMNITELQKNKQIKYVEICRKLHLKELADEKFDSDVTGNLKLQPLPSYKELKQENKVLDLKVKSFYEGVLYETEDPNFPVKSVQNKEIEEGPSLSPEEGSPAVLPLVDVISQNAMRRKIFLNSAKKAVQQLLLNLRLPPLIIIPELQSLIKTFNLKADNIVFKPAAWNYISVGLIKLLSLRNKDIVEHLDEGSTEYMNLLIQEMPSKYGFIDYILDLAQNLDLLIKACLESNSV